ncbi:MAG: hypothetical protein JWR65_2222 [Massilia sp.]|jgi:hypothetical protein|nr:hypothetical protein [Massilia sp.]
MHELTLSLPRTHSGGKELYFISFGDTLRGPYTGWQLWSMEKSGEIARDTLVWSPGFSARIPLRKILFELTKPVESSICYASASSYEAARQNQSDFGSARAVLPPPKELGFLTQDMIDQSSLPAESHLDAPDRMRVSESFTVTYRIAPPGVVESEGARTLRMTCLMGARLTGGGFDIVSGGTETKAVRPDGVNEWTWDVTPKEHGRRTLKVIVTGHVLLEGRSMPTEYVAETRIIDVKVSIGGYVKQHWMTLAGLLLTAMSLPYISEWMGKFLN